MIPGLVGAGLGVGLGGSILGAYGQGQAAKSMAEVRKRQIEEQQRLQNEGLGNARAFVSDTNPEALLAGSAQAPNAVAQGELAKLGAAGQSVGLGAGNAGSALGAFQNQNMGDQAIQHQLAAPGLAEHYRGLRLSDLSHRNRALEEQAARRAALYNQQLQLAGMNGMASRTLGGLAQLGGAGLSTAGMLMSPAAAGAFTVPGSATTALPAVTTPAQAAMSNAMFPTFG